MRKPSKYVLRSELDSVKAELNVYQAAMRYTNRGKADDHEFIRIDGGTYTIALYGSTAAHGGIIVEYWKADKNAHVSITALTFDDYRRRFESRSTETIRKFADACDRLALERDSLIQAEVSRVNYGR